MPQLACSRHAAAVLQSPWCCRGAAAMLLPPCCCCHADLAPISLPHILSALQGEAVKLGNSCAALLEGRGASWADALAADSQWRLVRLLSPEA